MKNKQIISVATIVSLLEKRENISNVAIEMITNITQSEEENILNMSIQQGLAVLTEWLVKALNNPEVSGIRALELFPPTSSEERREIDTYTIIAGARFRDRITLSDWKKAEALAIMNGKESLFTLYLFSVCCVDGRKRGIEIFSQMDLNSDILEGMQEFNRKQKSNPYFSVDLLTDFKFLVIGTQKRLLLDEPFFLPRFP